LNAPDALTDSSHLLVLCPLRSRCRAAFAPGFVAFVAVMKIIARGRSMSIKTLLRLNKIFEGFLFLQTEILFRMENSAKGFTLTVDNKGQSSFSGKVFYTKLHSKAHRGDVEERDEETTKVGR
jgi:hypothetical protein